MGLLRGHMLMMQPAFAVVFWCEPERQQSGLAVLEEGHRAMRRWFAQLCSQALLLLYRACRPEVLLQWFFSWCV